MKITRITGTFPSTSGLCRCRYYMYIPENPRAAVMLSHGMCEYFQRYCGFAEFLCRNGIALVGTTTSAMGIPSPTATCWAISARRAATCIW